MKLGFTALLILWPNVVVADEITNLTLDASNCAIARALHAPLPMGCESRPLEQANGMVIRLDDEIRSTQETKATQKNKTAYSGGYSIHFGANSSRLTPQYKAHLRQLNQILQLPALMNNCLRITGHTDANGSKAYNKQLSLKRALSVGTYLSQLGQITPSRILIRARGEDDPLPHIAPYDAKQRRVEFEIKPKGDSGCLS